MDTEKSVVEQAANALRLWSNAWNEFDKTGKNKPETLKEVIAPFIEMEKEQKQSEYTRGFDDGFQRKQQELDHLRGKNHSCQDNFKSE